MQIDAVLFDNDGVLVDTEELFYRANCEIFDEHGLTLKQEVFAECSLGQGQSVLRLIGDMTLDEHNALRDLRNAIYAEMLRAGVRIFDGVEACLEELHGQQPMAIVSSAYPDHFAIIHEQTLLLRYFEFALKNGDYGHHKPHPEPYLLAAQRLGVEPGNCVVVENSERGLEAATRAGMRCIVVPNRLAVDAEFRSAHKLIDSLRGLPQALADLGAATG